LSVTHSVFLFYRPFLTKLKFLGEFITKKYEQLNEVKKSPSARSFPDANGRLFFQISACNMET